MLTRINFKMTSAENMWENNGLSFYTVMIKMAKIMLRENEWILVLNHIMLRHTAIVREI